MEKVLILMIALSMVASATAAEKMSETTPTPEVMDCTTITDAAAKKDCESKAKTEAPADKKVAPATK